MLLLHNGNAPGKCPGERGISKAQSMRSLDINMTNSGNPEINHRLKQNELYKAEDDVEKQSIMVTLIY